MRKIDRKLAVVSALRAEPDFSKLLLACTGSEREMRNFQQWLDQSGIALYLLHRIREAGQVENLPRQFRVQLERRLESNRRRNEAMLFEVRKVSESLRNRGVRHAFLKGFTLAPAFSPEVALRHQCDIDILISEGGAEQARAAIRACGYSLRREMRKYEARFAMPLKSVPSAADDIYREDYDRQIELHTSIWEKVGQVRLDVRRDFLDRTCIRHIRGFPFASLQEEDAFLLHVVHAFRHFLSSWVRLSWLWEIHYFLARHREDSGRWLVIRDLAGDDPVVKNAFGLILGLTNHIFGSPLPDVLRTWCIETLPDRVKCWITSFGTPWSLSEMPGSKLTLFIHKEFIREPGLWRHLCRGIFPFAGRPSLGEMDFPSAETALRFSIQQQIFRAGRLVFHAKSLVSLSVGAFRWRHALMRAANHGNALIIRRRNHIS